MTNEQNRRFTRKTLAVAVAAAFAAGGMQQSGAADITWAGGTGNWNVGANWIGGNVPAVGDNVFIDGGNAANSVVSVNTSPTINNLTIDSGDAVGINNGITLTVNGNLANAGALSVNAGASLTTLSIGPSTVFSGTGTVTLNSGAAAARLVGVASTNVLTQNAGHTIQGAGQFGQGIMGLINAGLVDANVNGGTLTMQLNSSVGVARSNSGTLRASNGGTLTILNTPLDNAGGTIAALAGSTVNLTGANTLITGGTLSTAGSGVINLTGNAALETLTIAGLVRVNNGTVGRLIGTITNNGTIDLASSGSTADLVLAGNVTLAGTGTVTMSNQLNNRIYGSPATSVLTNSAGHTIQGAGQLGVGAMGLANAGLIDANQSTALTVSLNNAGGVTRTNTGTLQASAGGTLSITQALLDNSGGMIAALNGSTVNLTGGSTRITGGTLSTSGSGVINFGGAATLDTLTNTGLVRLGNGTQGSLVGTITNLGTIELASSGSTADLVLAGNVTLVGNGTMTLSNQVNNRIYGVPNTSVLTNSAGHTIQGAGQLGVGLMGLANAGLIDANQSTALTIQPNTALGPVLNTGTLRGSGTGGLTLTGGTFDNQGIVEALNGSSVTYTSSATTANNLAGVLTGGLWRAESTGSGATVTLRGQHITTNAADVYLSGAGSVIQVTNPSLVTQSLDNTLHTNDGSLRLQNGRSFTAAANSGNFTNNGLLEVTGSSFTSNTLASNGTITSFGTSTVATAAGNPITGNGAIFANTGTLTITRGVNMGPNSVMTSNAGATFDLSNAAQASRIAVLHSHGTLNLGAQNIVVTADYNNNNFGEGNAFDRRANVSGAGQLIGETAAMTITGAVTPAGANTWTLNLGNVRGGSSTTADYQVANSGTGTAIRGAVQTAVNGGNITDSRLSGAGVTAANLPQLGAGINTGNLAVTFNATSGGALAGQSIAVVSNFDNVPTQIINLSGFASALAQGNATPSPAVNLGNFRVGAAAPSQAFAVQNTTVGAGAERLGIAAAGATGNFSATNVLGGGFIDPGVTQAGAVTAAVAGGVAGVNNGTLTIQYTTNGQLIDPSFTTINANSQAIALSATGFNAAVGSAAPAGPVNLGNVRIGGSLGQTFTVSNTAPAGAFSEDLHAAFGANTGAASNNGGSISGLLAGASNNAAMGASLDTATAGAKSGTVTINYQTAGAVNGVGNGLGSAAAGSQTITLNGNVYQLAQGQLNTTQLNFGTVQVGQSVFQNLSISNVASGPAGFVEDLNASFGAASGTGAGQIIGTGSLSGLAAGATNSSAMTVTVNTSIAGTINGAIAVNYFSAGAVGGVSNGLGTVAVGTSSFGVLGVIETGGQVVDQAQPVTNGVISPGAVAVNLGNVRVGALAQQALSVLNQATGNDQAALNASIASNGAPVTASGSFNLLAPGATDAASLVVGINTATAGAKAGSATISFVSDASNIGGCAPNCQMLLPDQTVNVSGGVFQVAQPNVPGNVNLGNFRLGAAPSQALVVTNTDASPAGYQEGLDAQVAGTAGKATAGGGPIVNLAQGASSGAITVGIDNGTATAGLNTGTVTLTLASNGSTTSGLPTLPLADAVINVSGTGYRIASPTLNTPSVNVFARVGDAAAATAPVSITNTSPDAFTEGLKVSIDGSGGNAQGAGSIANLAAGATDGSTIRVGLASTAAAGLSSGTVTLAFASTGAGTTGAADLALASQDVTVNGKIYTPAVAQLNTTAINFGIVRVGDAVAAQGVSVTNAAAATALNDTLAATMGAVGGPFNGAGSLSGLEAGQSGSGTLTVGLDTSAAGVFSGSATVDFASQNPDMADLALGGLQVALQAQVNNLADALFVRQSGAGTLSRSGNEFTLDLGTLFVGDSFAAVLGLRNDASGPADGLAGTFDLSAADDFSYLDWDPIAALVAGATAGGLQVGYTFSSDGLFEDLILFNWASVNGFGPDLGFTSSLRILARVVQQSGEVPEPRTIALILLAAGLAAGLRRRPSRAH